MIDELLEVKEYLEGNNIEKKCLFRILSLLSRYFKEQKMSHLEIRNAIFHWAGQYKIHIEYNLNSIIYQTMENSHPLYTGAEISVNNADIMEITSRFDSKNCRLIALALLCYAKCHADSRGIFCISAAALSNWLHINNGHLSSRYLPELIDFGYIKKVENEKSFTWNKQIKSKSLVLKMNVPLTQKGEYFLEGNDIQGLYSRVF